jgi:hypothetical protein
MAWRLAQFSPTVEQIPLSRMKLPRALLLSFCYWCLSTGQAAPLETTKVNSVNLTSINVTASEVIRSSFRSGSAEELAVYFNQQIELLIDTEAVDFQELRAKHAELILATFFRKHPPQSFQYVHQGGSARLRYITGIYQTAGQRFSVYLLMRQDAHRRLLINTLHLRKS